MSCVTVANFREMAPEVPVVMIELSGPADHTFVVAGAFPVGFASEHNQLQWLGRLQGQSIESQSAGTRLRSH
jgi:hypothetical protein